MPKILTFPALKPEDHIFWTIIIEEGNRDSYNALWDEAERKWLCCITTYSFDRLPDLKEKVLHQIKATKALNGGVLR